MKDLILYGNKINDTICLYDKEFIIGQPNNDCRVINSVGGIGNHVDAITSTSLDLKFCVEYVSPSEDDPISSAVVIIDKKDGKRRKSSCVKWGCDAKLNTQNLVHEQSRWHHISYIDALPNLVAEDIFPMHDVAGIVSIDFCGANFRYDPSIFNWVDFIITSDTESNKIPDEFRFKSIIHSPEGTTFWDKCEARFKHIKNPIPLDDDICILGAGDAYCVSFIQRYMKSHSKEESIRFAHENAYEFLVKKYKL
jgi:hypothetical protein